MFKKEALETDEEEKQAPYGLHDICPHGRHAVPPCNGHERKAIEKATVWPAMH